MLRQYFKERVQLTSAQIREYYSNLEGGDSESLRRLVNRDLQDLTTEGFLKVFDEEDTVTEITGEIPKGKRALYVLAAARSSDVYGIGTLRGMGGDLLAAMNVKSALRIENGIRIDKECISIIFELGAGPVTIQIPKEDRPIRLFFSRKLNLTSSESIRQLENAKVGPGLGRATRLANVLLPISTLSSFKDSDKPGHFAIDIARDKLFIVDLASKNKTYVAHLNDKMVEELKSAPLPKPGVTATTMWSSGVLQSLKPIQLAGQKAQELTGPALVQASKEFKLLVI